MNGVVINTEILPYNELFKPRVFIIASLKPIPEQIKQKLENKGFYAIDEIYPGGKGVTELSSIIARSLDI